MKVIIIFALVAFFSDVTPPKGGIDEAVRAIKQFYAETAVAISLAQKGEPGGLYSNELVINSRNGSWRAVGNYRKTMTFWYSDQPEFVAQEGKSPESALGKVEINETASVRSLYREFLFKEGNLVFYFQREKAGEESDLEERCYFADNNLLVRLAPGAETERFTPQPIFQEAKYLQKLFLSTFAE